MPAQHAHHCVMTALGRNWYIVRLDGHLITLTRKRRAIVIDLKNVNYESYCSKAVEMLFTGSAPENSPTPERPAYD